MDKIALNRFFLNESSRSERGEVISWMLDPANDVVLKSWMKEHWDMFSPLDSAASDPEIDMIWLQVKASITKEAVQRNTVPSGNRINRYRQVAAAAILILVMTGGYYFIKKQSGPAAENPLAHYGHNLHHITNTSATDKSVYLEDGSKVILRKNASLDYPAHFTGNKREISLTGDAFFDIKKDASKAFLIYAENIVTKVLGTSFNIHSSPVSKAVTISVLTGSVQVFERNGAGNIEVNNKALKTNGVILTANEKVIYTKEKNDFQLTLVESPLPLAEAAVRKGDFDFNREKLTTVIKKIELTFGIEIVLESERFNNCIFSGDLYEENLYDKLDIICKAVNAVYEVSGTRILIKGEGCK